MGQHPVGLAGTEVLERNRVTVFFRLLLAVPLLVWGYAWGIAGAVAVLVNWLLTLIMGRSPGVLHNFLAALLRFRIHVASYLGLLSDSYPGFLGKAGSYPIDVVVPEPGLQNRWKTFFRGVLAVPAYMIGAALGFALLLVGVLGWFASLATGRMPAGLERLGLYCLRYDAQQYAYLYLLTDRYPYSGPEATLQQA